MGLHPKKHVDFKNMLVNIPKTFVVCVSVCGMGMLIPFCCRTDAGDRQAVSVFSVLRRPCGPYDAQWDGRTALMEAAAGGHSSAVELLLKHHASVDEADGVGWHCLPLCSRGLPNVLMFKSDGEPIFEVQLFVWDYTPRNTSLSRIYLPLSPKRWLCV